MTNLVLLTTLSLVMAACGRSSFTTIKTCYVEGEEFVCNDGTTVPFPEDGAPGQDGEDAVLLTEHKVEANKCVKIADDLYIENIQNGLIYDVYMEPGCNVEATEYCDNVEPSFGGRTSLGENQPGGAEVCWAGNRMISGEKVGNDLLIRVLDFN